MVRRHENFLGEMKGSLKSHRLGDIDYQQCDPALQRTSLKRLMRGKRKKLWPPLLTGVILLLLLFVQGDSQLKLLSQFGRGSVFISYAYSEGTRSGAPRNLQFFLQHGVSEQPKAQVIMYGIVMNGNCTSSVSQNPLAYVKKPMQHTVRVWARENIGLDFGAHAHALREMRVGKFHFDFYIFLNCGVIGPLVPSYMPRSWHWSSAFTDKIRGDVGLVGTSIVCLPPTDAGGYGPSVEGFAFSLSYKALTIVLERGTSFRNHADKVSAILDGEYALTDVLLQNGVGIDSLLQAYQGVNWSDSKEWNCNNLTHPSRHGSYFGISIHPYEVIFHKTKWGSESERHADALEHLPVRENETNLYMQWAESSATRLKYIDV